MDERQFQDMWAVMRDHNLQLTDDTSSEYECMICKKIVINACTAPCKCLFCLDCIKMHLKNGRRTCPGPTRFCGIEDIDFDTDIHINRVYNKIISKLSIKCPNEGCPSQVQLNMIGDHLRVCGNQSIYCPYLILGCKGDKLRNDQMRDHLSMEIHPHTKLLINWILNLQTESKSMKSDIDKLKGDVAKLNRDNDELKAQTKVDNEDTEKLLQKLRRKEKENTTEIQTLNDEMCALKNSNRSTIKKLRESEENTKQQISQLNAQVENQINQIAELKQRCELAETKCEETLHQLEKYHGSKVVEISQACNALKTETTKTSTSIENIREIIDETISEEFNWTIDKLSERVEDSRYGIYINSKSYFTHKNGFKFSLALWHCSADDEMSIKFHIEKGPFDDYLRWPFDRDLELSLMNRQTGLAYKTKTKKTFNIDSSNSEIKRVQKPTTEQNDEIWIFFISLDELSNHPELTSDDEISVKLAIKPASIDLLIDCESKFKNK